MIILIDSREKQNTHITDSFDKNSIAYKKKALDYGDYSFEYLYKEFTFMDGTPFGIVEED